MEVSRQPLNVPELNTGLGSSQADAVAREEQLRAAFEATALSIPRLAGRQVYLKSGPDNTTAVLLASPQDSDFIFVDTGLLGAPDKFVVAAPIECGSHRAVYDLTLLSLRQFSRRLLSCTGGGHIERTSERIRAHGTSREFGDGDLAQAAALIASLVPKDEKSSAS